MSETIEPICKFKCPECESYYTKVTTYKDYLARTPTIFDICTVINECGCQKMERCDNCDEHRNVHRPSDFVFDKEYLGKVFTMPRFEMRSDYSDNDDI